jgi:hypothetical protein
MFQSKIAPVQSYLNKNITTGLGREIQALLFHLIVKFSGTIGQLLKRGFCVCRNRFSYTVPSKRFFNQCFFRSIQPLGQFTLCFAVLPGPQVFGKL